jgi:hypothetical protein
MWLLIALLGALLFASAGVGAGIVIGARQPNQVWRISLGPGYIAIGRIVGDTECQRMQARGLLIECARHYGAILFLRQFGSGDGSDQSYTLFTIPDPQPWR